MKYLSVLALIAVPLAASASIVTSSVDYDDSGRSLVMLECYDYLSAQGDKTFGDVSWYPFVGGGTVIKGTNSPYCGSRCFSGFDFVTPTLTVHPTTGSCWDITFQGVTVSVMMVDTVRSLAADYFVVSTAAMDQLTCVSFYHSFPNSLC